MVGDPMVLDIAWIGGWTSGWLFAASMVIVFFYFLARGRLRTGREVEELRNDRDARVAEAQKDRDARVTEALAWRTAHERQVEINKQLTEQNLKLLSMSEVSAHLLASLPKQSGHEGGDSDVRR